MENTHEWVTIQEATWRCREFAAKTPRSRFGNHASHKIVHVLKSEEELALDNSIIETSPMWYAKATREEVKANPALKGLWRRRG